MKILPDEIPTIENPEVLWQRAEDLCRQAQELRRLGLVSLVKRFGLEAGVTRVRQGNLEGYFLEPLNYVDGQLRIRVRLDPPLPERWGVCRNFYEDWKKVQ